VTSANVETLRKGLVLSERIASALVLALYLLLSLLVFNQIEEDAFIDFRQIANLADGYGFVFNRGGERIEATSSLLWVIVLLAVRGLPLDIVIIAKLLGLVAGCLSLWLVFRISRQQISNSVLVFGPPLLTVASIPFLMWSQRGLEPPMLTLIVLCLAVCWTDEKWFPWWPAAGVALVLVRPEGPLFLLASVPLLRTDRQAWRRASSGIAVVAAAAVAVIVGRFLYFHDLVPSPFYVKLHTEGGEGVDQIRKYLLHNHILFIGMPLFLVAWRPRFWTRSRVVLALLIVISAGWCALAKDYMAYTRQLVPAVPLLYILICAGADGLAPALGRWRNPTMAAYVALGCFATLFLSKTSGEFTSTRDNAVKPYLRAFVSDPWAFAASTAAKVRSPEDFGYLDLALERYTTMGTTFQSRIGMFLQRNYPPDAVVLYDQMGQTPSYAGASMRFVDTLGLTDRTVGQFYFARRKRTEPVLRAYDGVLSAALWHVFGETRRDPTPQDVLDYLFATNPDVILLHQLVLESEPNGISVHLSRDPRLTMKYEHRYTLARFVEVFERRDSPRRQNPDIPPGLFVISHPMQQGSP